MNRKILIGIAGGALALALAGGAVYAGPSLNRSLAATQAATPTAQTGGNSGEVVRLPVRYQQTSKPSTSGQTWKTRLRM